MVTHTTASAQATADALVAQYDEAYTATLSLVPTYTVPWVQFLAAKAGAEADWANEIAPVYVTYQTDLANLDKDYTQSVTDANVTYVSASAAAERSWSTTVASLEYSHDITIAGEERTYRQAMAPVEHTYNVAIANADRDHDVALAQAQRNLTVDGDNEAYQDAVDAANDAQSAAHVAAGEAWTTSQDAAEEAYQDALDTVEIDLAIGRAQADQAKTVAIASADKTWTLAEANANATRETQAAGLGADFWIASATSYSNHMTLMANANDTPWAWQVADAAAAEAARALTMAYAERDQQIANINAELARITAEANAQYTLTVAEAAAAASYAVDNAWETFPNQHGLPALASISSDPSLDVYAGMAWEGPREWWARFNDFGLVGDRYYEGLVSGMFTTQYWWWQDGRSTSQRVGEDLLRPLVGDEHLETLERVLEGTLVVLAVAGVGVSALVLGPVAFFAAAAIGFGSAFTVDVAAQWDETGWQGIDWGQAVTAGLTGAVVSVITAGLGSGIIGALVSKFPGACTVITMSMRGLSLISGGWGLYQGAVSISEGKYATGALQIIGAVTSIYGGMKISFCFVAGTGVVLEPLNNSIWIITLVGIGLVGATAINRRKRREEDDQAIDVCFSALPPDDDDEPEKSVATGRECKLSQAELDSLCDRLFSDGNEEPLVEADTAWESSPIATARVLDRPTVRAERIPQELTMARTLTATKPTKGIARKRSNLAHWWLAACLLLATCVGVFAPTLRTKPIEQVAVGERVAGHNPLREQVDQDLPEPDPATWKKVDLRMTKSDGKRLDMTFLWPLETMAETGAKVGATIPIDMPEMGAEGEATVLAIGSCPPIKPGSGNIVTGTFKHEAAEDCVNVLIAGASEPIGATSSHPFWSEDRQDFVAAGSLGPGERVWTETFGIVRAESVTPLPGQHTVYNIQVHGEHVYQVTNLGVLVHNACSRFQTRTPTQVAKLRHTFDRSGGARSRFLKNLARQEGATERWGAAAVANMERGKVPDGMVVHHKTPLFRGGNNRYSNLELMDRAFHEENFQWLHYYEEGMNPYTLGLLP